MIDDLDMKDPAEESEEETLPPGMHVVEDGEDDDDDKDGDLVEEDLDNAATGEEDSDAL